MAQNRRHKKQQAPTRAIVAILAMLGATTAGCFQVQPQPPLPNLPPTTMSSWGPAGGFTMTSGSTCAGRATLNLGKASVTDPCFTSADNIVLCTDTTAPFAVQCAPENGFLIISGSGADTISYARMK
jgi:hypothetical protein